MKQGGKTLMPRRRSFGLLLATLPFVTFAGAGATQAAYPDRPITLIVPWGAGGGTDATARIVASLTERELGVPVNVVNRTGGSGVVGHSAIASAPPDGYTLGIVTTEINMLHWEGLTPLTYKDFTPLVLFNEDSAGLQVRTDSPHKTAKDLLEAVRAQPAGTFKASGTGQGGSWHLSLAGMLRAAGMEPGRVQWVPSQGAAPGLQDLVAGGVDIVTCSVPEALSLIQAGKVRSLATMAAERNRAFADVPTLKEAAGIDWTFSVWRGVAGPKALPQAVADRLVPVLKKVHDSQEFRDFMAKQGFGVAWRGPQEFAEFLAMNDQTLGGLMRDLGLAK
jgi:tripartite-type tricarboxylate transporter receptor subunit TctC